MSGASSAGDGAAHSADNGAFSPGLGHGEREERDAASLFPKKSSGSAAAGASPASQDVKGVHSTSAEPTAGGHDAGAAVDIGKHMLDEISELKRKQKEARDAKLAVGKELRNAQRRQKRLKTRAKQLSDEDLLAVISLRNHEKAKTQRKGNLEEEAPVDPDASPSSGACPGETYSSTTMARRC